MLSETKSRLSANKAGFAVKTSFLISIVFTGLIAAGCSTTTYFNLKDKSPRYISMKLDDAKKSESMGVELSLQLMDGTEINGELLSVRENSMTICTEHSATEEELAKLIYSTSVVQNNEIQDVIIEGSSYVWIGIGGGYLVGGSIGMLVASGASGGSREEGLAIFAGAAIGGFLGSIAGGVLGNLFSSETYILLEIPPGYDFFLKTFARYPDEEPEYLKKLSEN